MGRFINRGFVKLGEVGRLGASIMTGANLRRPKPADDKEPAKK